MSAGLIYTGHGGMIVGFIEILFIFTGLLGLTGNFLGRVITIGSGQVMGVFAGAPLSK